MRIFTLLLVLLIPVTSAANAIKDAGASSCGGWVEDRKQDSYHPKLHWIQGFISAYNQYVYSGKNPNGVFGSADHNAIAVWMDNYCHQNPLSSPHEGTVLLIRELDRRAK